VRFSNTRRRSLETDISHYTSANAMSEIEEVERFLEQATYPGVKTNLQQYLKKIRLSESLSSGTAVDTAVPATAGTPASVEEAIHSKVVPSTITSNPTKFINHAGTYIPVENFSWDQGSHNAPIVTVYVDIPNVGSVKDNVQVVFGKSSFDLKVHGCDGKNYRLLKDNLDKDIIPEQSKFIVKKDKVVIKLQKVKGEYSYDSWTSLTAKKPRDPTKEAEKKKDPMGGIMDMMKDMYEDGDENMKKIIGEAMLKSKSGEKPEPPSYDKDF